VYEQKTAHTVCVLVALLPVLASVVDAHCSSHGLTDAESVGVDQKCPCRQRTALHQRHPDTQTYLTHYVILTDF